MSQFYNKARRALAERVFGKNADTFLNVADQIDNVVESGARSALKGLRSLYDDRTNPFSSRRVLKFGNKRRKRTASKPYKPSPEKRRRSSGGRGHPVPGRFRTTGYAGKYVKRGRRRRKDMYLKNGVVLKYEDGGNQHGSESVILGHNTHPLKAVLKAMGLAIARLAARKWGDDFSDTSQKVYENNVTSGIEFRLDIMWREELAGALQTDSGTPLTDPTWDEVGKYIADRIIALVKASTSNFEFSIHSMVVSITDSGHYLYPRLLFDADKLFIHVRGTSVLSMQNVTQATAGGSAEDKESTNVTNNPVVGKSYDGWGQSHLFRYDNDFAGVRPVLAYGQLDGSLFFNTDSTDLTPAMRANLIEGPPRWSFSNVNSQGTVKINPGEIKKSWIGRSYMFKLNTWIHKIARAIYEHTDIDDINLNDTQIGKNRFFIIEKMCDIRDNEPETTIDYEIHRIVSAYATYYPRRYCQPVNENVADIPPE